MSKKEDVSSPASKSQGNRAGLMEVAKTAAEEFANLSGLVPELISGARPEDPGWSLLVDVTELERTPPTGSIMATYRIDTDEDGHLTSWERMRRFNRSATDLT